MQVLLMDDAIVTEDIACFSEGMREKVVLLDRNLPGTEDLGV